MFSCWYVNWHQAQGSQQIGEILPAIKSNVATCYGLKNLYACHNSTAVKWVRMLQPRARDRVRVGMGCTKRQNGEFRLSSRRKWYLKDETARLATSDFMIFRISFPPKVHEMGFLATYNFEIQNLAWSWPLGWIGPRFNSCHLLCFIGRLWKLL